MSNHKPGSSAKKQPIGLSAACKVTPYHTGISAVEPGVFFLSPHWSGVAYRPGISGPPAVACRAILAFPPGRVSSPATECTQRAEQPEEGQQTAQAAYGPPSYARRGLVGDIRCLLEEGRAVFLGGATGKL